MFSNKVWKRLLIALVCLVCLISAFSGAENNTTQQNDKPEYNVFFSRESNPKVYIENGEFYSQNKPGSLSIDLSLVDEFEAALYWYDKVIEDFPESEEVNQALKLKIRTLIGWEEGYGDRKESYGLKADYLTNQYFDRIEKTFNQLETSYPEDEQLEAYAYQIAQSHLYQIFVYRRQKSRQPSIKWLNKTIELSNGEDTFYSHLSKLTLEYLNKRGIK